MRLLLTLGYLGSGKTTFLSDMLRSTKKQRTAVVVNDFGSSDVDGLLLRPYTSVMRSITDGSLFCSCRSDKFVETVLELSRGDFDQIVVETSGLANPSAMLSVLGLIQEKSGGRIDFAGSVCIVGAPDFEKVLSTVHMVRMQVACADLIVLNKCDLSDDIALARVEETLRALNPAAEICRAVRGKVPKKLLDGLRYNEDKVIPPNIEDINTQKLKLVPLKKVTAGQADALAVRLSVFAHRIKGVLRLDGALCVYEYANGTRHTVETEGAEEQFIVVLAVTQKNLKKETAAVLADFPEWKILG